MPAQTKESIIANKGKEVYNMVWSAEIKNNRYVRKEADYDGWEAGLDWIYGTFLLRKQTWVDPPYYEIRIPSKEGYDYIVFTIKKVNDGWAEIALDGYRHRGWNNRFYTADRYTDKYTGIVEHVVSAIVCGDIMKH